jgi:hypothetical protein
MAMADAAGATVWPEASRHQGDKHSWIVPYMERSTRDMHAKDQPKRGSPSTIKLVMTHSHGYAPDMLENSHDVGI